MEFPLLDDEEVADAVAKGGAGRLKYFLQSVAASGVLCAWGDEDGMSVMEDADGMAVLSVWPHPVFAEKEMNSTAEPGFGPILLEIKRFIDVTLPSLEDQGMGLAVFPVEDRIAVSLSPEQFRSKIAAAVRNTGRSR